MAKYEEVLPSSFRYNGKETVDTVFLKLLIANLFKDQTFKAGITFNDKLNERGGNLYARKLGKVDVTQTKTTDANGLKFKHTNTQDQLVLIQKLDRISVSEECYDLVENLRASGKSVDKVSEVIESFKEKCQMLYTSYLLAEPAAAGSVGVGGATRSANTTADDTLEKLTASVLKDREQIKVNGGIANVLIVSPEMETLFLASASKAANAFIPETNEEMLKDGKIGRLYGLNVFTSNLIGSGTPLGEGSAAKNTGNAAKCEYIIYDYNAFAIAGDIETLRLKDAIDFTGCYAQIEGVFGGGITNAALAYAKIVVKYTKCEGLTAFAEGVTYYTKNSNGEYVEVASTDTFNSSKTYYICE